MDKGFDVELHWSFTGGEARVFIEYIFIYDI